MKKLFTYLRTSGIVIIIIFVFVVFSVKTVETIPGNAIVLVSDKTKLIYSPKFFSDHFIEFDSLRACTYKEAKSIKYKAHKKGRDEGYFTNEQGSIVWGWLDSAGILKQKTRWNKDGSWNW